MTEYHHFKGNKLTRAEKIQRKVVQMLIKSKVPDKQRDDSIVWELKHSASCIQVGRILAEKRNLDIELAEIICALHDIYTIIKGKYKDHAKKSAEIAKKILEKSKDFSKDEIKLITEAIAQHSEKQIYTDNHYVELAKDADIFDCCLYDGVAEYYKVHKPKEVYNEYVNRIRKVKKELGIKNIKIFRG